MNPPAVWNPEKFFGGLPLFASLPSGELKRFAWKSQRRRLSKGEVIFQEGEAADAAWWVIDGYVKIAKPTPQGRSLTMELLVGGDVFAPAGIMPLETYPATAVAVTDGAVARVPAAEMRELARSQPALPQAVLSEVGGRLQRSHQLRALDAEGADVKVAAALLWLSAKAGPRIAISRREIADIAGVAQETAIRTVLDFKKKQWIRTAGRSIALSDAPALRRLVEPF